MKTCIKWTTEEDNILRNNYQLRKQDLLHLLPNRTPAAINIHASKLGLKKQHNEYVQSNLAILLEENPISYYWMGFILADGHISNNKRLIITLAIKDKHHLKKLAQYIHWKKIIYDYRKTKCTINPQDKYYIQQLTQKFDISHRKTYYPPATFDWIQSNDLFLALFCGYIDGDGQIRHQWKRKDCCISIHIYSSWQQLLDECIKRLNTIYNTQSPLGRIGKDGYYNVNITNSVIIHALKKFAIQQQLPILQRKWQKIDTTRISKQVIAQQNANKILQLYQQNTNNTKIAQLLNVSRQYVGTQLYRMRKRGIIS